MKPLAPLTLVWLAAACATVGPDYAAPETEVPASFRQDLTAWGPQLGGEGALDLATWWRAFDDPVLADLVERALADNHDLHAALSRIAEAEARLGVSRALRRPRLDADASYTRSGISENTQFGLFPGQERESDSYDAGLTASWEVDLWGRAARGIEASEADLAARAFDLWAARVSLVGQVADAYLRLRELQVRVGLANDNVDVLKQSLEMSQARFDAGLVEELDVLRARTALESARATLPQLRGLQASVVTELGVLLAAEPGELDALVAGPASAVPTAGGQLGAQIPADLLRRRPDVRGLERTLAAETARIGVATADLYPELTLIGSIGLSSEKPENLLEGGSLIHQLGPRLTMPLFSSGAIRANIEAQDERAKQALIAYEAGVTLALHEVDGAATAIAWSAARLDAVERAIAEAERSLERSDALYKEGLSTIDAVLDARRELFSLEDARAQVRALLSRSYVDLFRALGGGWPASKGEPEANPALNETQA